MREACAVTTRSQANKARECIPLKVPGTKESPVVHRDDVLMTRAYRNIGRKMM